MRSCGLLRRPRRAVYVPAALRILPWVELGFGWLIDRLAPFFLPPSFYGSASSASFSACTTISNVALKATNRAAASCRRQSNGSATADCLGWRRRSGLLRHAQPEVD